MILFYYYYLKEEPKLNVSVTVFCPKLLQLVLQMNW